MCRICRWKSNDSQDRKGEKRIMSDELVVLENIIGVMQASHPETALEKCTLGFLEELYRIKVKECCSGEKSNWIPVGEALPPENAVNPVTKDGYVYPVTVDFGSAKDVRYYTFWKGHWWPLSVPATFCLK